MGCMAIGYLDYYHIIDKGVYALRLTAAMNALDHQADIAKIQEWLGHTNISTPHLYDRCKHRAIGSIGKATIAIYRREINSLVDFVVYWVR
jgi:integrase